MGGLGERIALVGDLHERDRNISGLSLLLLGALRGAPVCRHSSRGLAKHDIRVGRRQLLHRLVFLFYFAELIDFSKSGGNDKREFSIYCCNHFHWFGPYSPSYLQPFAFHSVDFFSSGTRYFLSLEADENSTLPPLINGIELHARLLFHLVITDPDDGAAIVAKRHWIGDPCYPIRFPWEGLTCLDVHNASRITEVNLSSSGLTGTISDSFKLLREIKTLDLSYNNLNGTIPEWLAYLWSLRVLNLSGNRFSGPIPDALLQKANAGLLILRTEDIDCGDSCGPATKHSSMAVIIAISLTAFLVILVTGLLVIYIVRKRRDVRNSTANPKDANYSEKDDEVNSLKLESRQFTYKDLEIITNNFEKIIGQGGFGTVYHGFLETTQVAVKIQSESSLQGIRDFLGEARHLARIHHRYLVSLIGYCKEGNCVALISQYMPEGTLEEHLRGKSCKSRPLSWRQRLQIAHESAQGLEYLHNGCSLPLIHRDVKTSNILLNANLEARIADFGLSKPSRLIQILTFPLLWLVHLVI